jgi:hypothetical protein
MGQQMVVRVVIRRVVQLSRRRMLRRRRGMLSSRTWPHCRRGRAAR